MQEYHNAYCRMQGIVQKKQWKISNRIDTRNVEPCNNGILCLYIIICSFPSRMSVLIDMLKQSFFDPIVFNELYA